MLVNRSLDVRKSSRELRLALRAEASGHAIIAFFQKLRDAGGTRKTRHAAHGGFEIALALPWPSKTEKRCAMVPFRCATYRIPFLRLHARTTSQQTLKTALNAFSSVWTLAEQPFGRHVAVSHFGVKLRLDPRGLGFADRLCKFGLWAHHFIELREEDQVFGSYLVPGTIIVSRPLGSL
jgi:hypothetical protein